MVTEGLRQRRAAERREKLLRLMVRRFTARELATMLSVSVRTIESDLQAIRREGLAEITRSTVMTVAAEVRRDSAARIRELWLIYQQACGERTEDGKGWQVRPDQETRIAALRELRAVAKDELAALQSLGVYYKAPERVSLSMRIDATLERLTPEELAALVRAPDEEFLRRVTELLGPEVLEPVCAPERGLRALAAGGSVVDSDVTDGELAGAEQSYEDGEEGKG